MNIKELFILITISTAFSSTSSSQDTDSIDNWEANLHRFKHQARSKRHLDGNRDCVNNDDCNSHDKCEHNKCISACESNSCGLNTWHSIKMPHVCNCNCWSGFSGDPYTKCTKNCTTNSDCDDFESCDNNECVEVCVPGKCQNVSAMCIAYKHRPICICSPGLSGDPHTKCVERCETNKDCKHSQKCENNECKAASLCGSNSCGAFTRCDVKNGELNCSCLPGYGGDPSIECVRINCITHHDCDIDMKCENNNCVPSCDDFSCTPNAYCDVKKGHFPVCYCPKGFIGDPEIGCTEGCESNDDCDSFRKCEAAKCVNVCPAEISCGKHAACDVNQNRLPYCRCDPGYIGDPDKECRKYCTADSHCYGYEKCKDHMCISDVCKGYSCSGENEICDDGNNGAVCICKKGYMKDHLSNKCVAGCNTSADCRSFLEDCRHNKCVAFKEISYTVDVV